MLKSMFQSTRIQIWLGFIAAVMFVFFMMSALSYGYVSKLLMSNAEKYTEEIASQTGGRLEALLHQIDTITLQATMDPLVQRTLSDIRAGSPVSINDQLGLRSPLMRYAGLTPLLQFMEVYSTEQAVYPAGNALLSDRIDPAWAGIADRESGKLIWIGLDPKVSDSIVGIRQVRLESDNYSRGGYIVINVSTTLLDFLDGKIASMEGSSMFLLNANHEIVSSRREGNLVVPTDALTRGDEQIDIGNESYRLFRKETGVEGWTLTMLIPMKSITKGVDVLQRIYFIGAAAGALLFVILSYILSTVVTKPIRKLIQVMRGNRKLRDGKFIKNAETYFNREINELNLTYNRMVDNVNDLIDEVYKKEIINMSTEIKALQAQIDPHFLYNTLEAFYWSLIRRGEEELASKVISLSNLFRYAIKQEGSEASGWVELEQELQHIQSYLEIMSMRMGDRLKWQLDIDPTALRVRVPKLLIQPIVENAILHGIEPKLTDGAISLAVRYEADNGILKVDVADTGVGLTADELARLTAKLRSGQQPEGKRTGIGLHNINKRLQLFYGEPSAIHIASVVGQGTTVALELPVRQEK